MDRKLILIVKNLLAGLLIFAGCFVFANIDLAKGVMSGFSVFLCEYFIVGNYFKNLLDKSGFYLTASMLLRK